MSKAKRGSKENPITSGDLEDILSKDKHWFNIIAASIKDDFCNYAYEITKGVGLGRIHKVDGKSGGLIVDKDMLTGFGKFNVHLAVIDDVYKHSKVEINDIDTFHTHELTGLFQVTGFKTSGGEENESVILIGNKYVSAAGGRIELESPKIALDNLSSYKWYNELKTAVDKAKLEVQLYEGGKGTAAEPEEPKDKLKQGKISFGMISGKDAAAGEKSEEEDNLSDFEKAKI